MPLAEALSLAQGKRGNLSAAILRGAGYFLLGVWGCPPALKKSPKTGGYRGLIENISALSR